MNRASAPDRVHQNLEANIRFTELDTRAFMQYYAPFPFSKGRQIKSFCFENSASFMRNNEGIIMYAFKNNPGRNVKTRS